jgi:tetratricopeptide (TPR) repeat protein
MREGALGSRHPALVRNLADLGEALRHQGHLAEALGVERRSLALGESILSADDGRLAGVGYELGITLGRAGRYAEALARLRRAEALTAKIYGPEHVYVAFVVAARADVLMLESRWRDAVTLYDRVIPVFAVSQGTEDVLAGALANRCRAHVELHQPGRALPPLERLARDLLERPADVRVVVQFTLARALSQTGGDGARAYQLATEAAAEIRLIADARREDVAHVEHWLATHARCTTCSSRPP